MQCFHLLFVEPVWRYEWQLFSFPLLYFIWSLVMCFAATRKSLLCLAGAGLMKEVHHVGKSPMTKDLLTDLTERKGQLRFQ